LPIDRPGRYGVLFFAEDESGLRCERLVTLVALNADGSAPPLEEELEPEAPAVLRFASGCGCGAGGGSAALWLLLGSGLWQLLIGAARAALRR
jgi:hypothetical protein